MITGHPLDAPEFLRTLTQANGEVSRVLGVRPLEIIWMEDATYPGGLRCVERVPVGIEISPSDLWCRGLNLPEAVLFLAHEYTHALLDCPCDPPGSRTTPEKEHRADYCSGQVLFRAGFHPNDVAGFIEALGLIAGARHSSRLARGSFPSCE